MCVQNWSSQAYISRLLSGNEKQNLLQAVWESEKYCNEIQACRLPGIIS